MIGTFVLAGSALCASYGIYHYRSYHLAGAKLHGSTFNGAPVGDGALPETNTLKQPLENFWARFSPRGHTHASHTRERSLHRRNQTDLLASAALIGTAAVGGAGIIPLKYIAIPALAYRGVPAMQSTIDMLLNDRKARQGVLETTALAIVVVKGAWIVGTVGFAVYHLGRWVITATDDINTSSQGSYLVKRQNQEMTLSAEQIKVGDWISISASDPVPVNSTVVDGSAWIHPCSPPSSKTPITVKPGDALKKDSVVLAGSLWLKVVT